MTLVDPNSIEWMHFNGSGMASVSYGSDKDNVVGVAYNWRLVNGRLRLFDANDKIYDELTLISRDNVILVVRKRSGKIAKYRIIRLELKPGQHAKFSR